MNKYISVIDNKQYLFDKLQSYVDYNLLISNYVLLIVASILGFCKRICNKLFTALYYKVRLIIIYEAFPRIRKYNLFNLLKDYF